VTHASFEKDARVEYFALMGNFPVISKAPKTKTVSSISLNPQFKLSAPPSKVRPDLKKPPTELVAPLSLLFPKK
jgi:hypothetical protein